jgi:hypothetical protein
MSCKWVIKIVSRCENKRLAHVERLFMGLFCAIPRQAFVRSVMPGNFRQKPTSRICKSIKLGSPQDRQLSKAHVRSLVVYFFQITLFTWTRYRIIRPQACVTQNQENTSVLSTGQGEVINGRFKRIKLDGGETWRPFRWLNCCCCRSVASYGMAC